MHMHKNYEKHLQGLACGDCVSGNILCEGQLVAVEAVCVVYDLLTQLQLCCIQSRKQT